MPRIYTFIDLIGQKFGRLTVVSHVGMRKNHRYFKCICDCGKTKIIGYGSLKDGNAKSCGCLKLEKLTQKRTHGLSKDDIYKVHQSMINRCHNKNTKSYKNYGARGISVYDRWLVFENLAMIYLFTPIPTKSLKTKRLEFFKKQFQVSKHLTLDRMQQASKLFLKIGKSIATNLLLLSELTYNNHS